MKLWLFIISLLASASIASAQTEAPKPSPADEKFLQIIKEVQGLHGAQRYTEAIVKLQEAEALKPDSPMIHNVRGSIHTGMRDFAKARESFTKAQAASPTAFEPKFNLTELDYVQGLYKEAEAGFKKLLTDYPKLRMEVRHLTQFKVLVCQLKQNKLADAESSMKAFTFMDDTAAYYYAKAAFAFQKGSKPEAQEWLAKAGKIFKPNQNVPYLDTLMEARWVPSISVPDDPKK